MVRLGGLLLACLLVLVPAAPAAADDQWEVPPGATITVEGDGAGHGKGLSQYGAYGAARAGLSSKQILDFYYPGTKRAERGGKVRVWISGDDGRHLVVEDRPRLEVRTASGRSVPVHKKQPRADRWRITPAAKGAKVSYRQGRWRTFASYRGDVAFEAGGAPVTLRTPDGRVSYRGALRSTSRGGDRVTVNVLPLDKYVRGVVPAEVSSIWPTHAMRAQAVASRTYAVHEREHAGGRPYDLCDTAACQAYGGASAETAKSDAAVKATARSVLTWQGETAFAQYSASNGGWTVDGGLPYLPEQEDPYEGSSPDYYGWTVEVEAATVEDAYNIDHLTRIQVETRDGRGPRGGRVVAVRLWNDDSGWTGTVTGDSFRRNFGLASTLFELTSVS